MKPSEVTTVGVVLAAGASSRMGKAKQLLEINGQPLVARMSALALEAGFEAVVVVTGARRGAVEAVLPDFVHVVHNPNWATGMGSSVHAGLSFALSLFPKLQYSGFMVTDQPYLTSGLLRKMLSQLKQSSAPGIAAYYNGGLGVPAVFRAGLFPELLALDGQKGAKPILHKHREALQLVPFPEGAFDLDFPDDWERFLREQEG
ncbi:MAG: nucleotidyltransferase family protein [bacterium]|nr:nucleotidyltransferase family protein [bacterium]